MFTFCLFFSEALHILNLGSTEDLGRILRPHGTSYRVSCECAEVNSGCDSSSLPAPNTSWSLLRETKGTAQKR